MKTIRSWFKQGTALAAFALATFGLTAQAEDVTKWTGTTYESFATAPTTADAANKFISDMPAIVKDYIVVDAANKSVTLSSADAFAFITYLPNYLSARCVLDCAEKGYGDPRLSAYWVGSDPQPCWTINVATDIDLQNNAWKPATSGYSYLVDFKNHTVSNLKATGLTTNAGLFGDLYYAQNVTVDGAEVATTADNAGIFAGCLSGYVKNVTVKNATLSGGKYAGAVGGYVYGTIEGCKVLGTEASPVAITSATKEVGGVAGLFHATSLKNCEVAYVNVTGQEEVGGIVGRVLDGDDKTHAITDCTVANITLKATKNGETAVDAGIVGASAANYVGTICGRDYSSTLTITANDEQVYPVIAYEAQIGTKKYLTLAEAFTAAKENDKIEILIAGTYKLASTIPANVTIEGKVADVVFDCAGTGNIAGTSGITFTNVSFSMGQNNYHGFQGTTTVVMENCTINGKFFTYGNMTFTGCTFKQTEYDYCMWVYNSLSSPVTITYDGCTFDTIGKVLNVYCENNTAKVCNVVVKGCTFKNNDTEVKKPAVLIKSKCGATELSYNVNLVGTQKLVGPWPSATSLYTDGNIQNNGIWDVEGDGTKITVFENDEQIYPEVVACKIGDTKYKTLAAAIADVQNGETITMLKTVTEEFKVTGTGTDFTADLGSFGVGKMKLGCELANRTQNEKLTLKGTGYTVNGMWIGQADNDPVGDGDGGVEGWENLSFIVNVVGEENVTETINLGQIYLRTTGMLNITNATVTHDYVCDYGPINLYNSSLIAKGPNIIIAGRASKKAKDKAVITLDHSTLDFGSTAALEISDGASFSCAGSGKVILKNNSTAVGSSIWMGDNADGSLGTIAIESTDSTITLSGSGDFGRLRIGAGDYVSLKNSLVTLKSIVNNGEIRIDATGVTEPVKVIDYTGTTAMTLDSYGTVKVTNGYQAYVFDNDLWVKVAPAARIGSTEYGSLEAAIEAVQSGETIVLLAANAEEITMTKKVPFFIDRNGQTLSGSITPANGYEFTVTDEGASCSYSQYHSAACIGSQEYATLAAAIAAVKNGETITLLRDVAENVSFTAEMSVTLDLNGMVLSKANDNLPIITIGNGTVNTNIALTIKDTYEDGVAGHIYGGKAVCGGGVLNYGTLNLKSGTIDGCEAVYDGSDGVTGNGGGVANYALFNMTGGTIQDCKAGNLGGGVYSKTTGKGVGFFMTGGLITGCTAANGAGVASEGDGATELVGTSRIVMEFKEGFNSGSGVFANGGTLKIDGGEITVKPNSYTPSGATAAVTVTGTASVKINSGKVKSGVGDCVYIDTTDGQSEISGDAVITGSIAVDVKTTKGSITINGTVFNGSDEPEVAPGYTAKKSSDGTWVVERSVVKTETAETLNGTVKDANGNAASDDLKKQLDESISNTVEQIESDLSSTTVGDLPNSDIIGEVTNDDVKPSVIDQLQANAAKVSEAVAEKITDKTRVSSYMVIALNAADVQQAEANATTVTVKQVTFEVTPMAEVTVTTTSGEVTTTNVVKAVIENDWIAGSPITFRLPVQVAGTSVGIRHTKNSTLIEDFLAVVQEEDGVRFVEISSDTFSEYTEYELDGDVTIVAQVGEKYYDSLEEAIAAVPTNGTVILCANVTLTDAIALDQKPFTISCGDYTITGTITAANGYKIDTSNGWSYEQILVAQVGSTKYPTLEAAIDAASAGNTVLLLCDTEISERKDITKSLTLDLGGHTLTCSTSACRSFWVTVANVAFNFRNGSIVDGSEAEGYGIVDVRNGAKYASVSMTNVVVGVFDANGDCTSRFDTSCGSLIKARDEHIQVSLYGSKFGTDHWIIDDDYYSGGAFSITVKDCKAVIDHSHTCTYSKCGKDIYAFWVYAWDDSYPVSTFENVTILGNGGSVASVSGIYCNGPTAVTNCTITTTGTNRSAAIGVCNEETVSVNGGTYSGNYAGYVYSSGGRIDVNGGSYTGTQYAFHVDSRNSGNENVGTDAEIAVVNINDGTVTGNFSFQHKGQINIAGGRIGGTVTLMGETDADYMVISGGIYATDPSSTAFRNPVAKIADNCAVVTNPDSATVEAYPFAVVKCVAQVGETKYTTLADAIEAAEDDAVINIIGDISDETVTVPNSVTICGTKTGDVYDHTLTNVILIMSSGKTLTVRDLDFTGISYIRAGGGAALTVSGCYADVTPTRIGNDRGAFIHLGSEVASGLNLTVTNNTILATKGSNSSGDSYATSIFGWNYLGGATIANNVFGSVEKPYYFIGAKLMNAMDGAVFTITNNVVYGSDKNWYFAGFDLYQNCSRANAYTANLIDNEVINVNKDESSYTFKFAQIEANAGGYGAGHATILCLGSDNTLDGEAIELGDLDIQSDAVVYVGVGVDKDANGKLTSGTYNAVPTAADIASGYEAVAQGTTPETWVVQQKKVATLYKDGVKVADYASVTNAVKAYNDADPAEETAYLIEIYGGTHDVFDCAVIQSTKKSLTICPRRDGDAFEKVTLKADAGNPVFKISGISEYGTLPTEISGIAFDGSAYTSNIGMINMWSGDTVRYASHVTISNCTFQGDVHTNAYAVNANSHSSPSDIRILDCSATSVWSLWNGYLANNAGAGITVSRCTVTNSGYFVCETSGSADIVIDRCKAVVSKQGTRAYAVRYGGKDVNDSSGASIRITNSEFDGDDGYCLFVCWNKSSTPVSLYVDDYTVDHLTGNSRLWDVLNRQNDGTDSRFMIYRNGELVKTLTGISGSTSAYNGYFFKTVAQVISSDGVTTNGFDTLQAAFNRVQENGTINVLAANTETITVTNTCSFTFNSNGYDLSDSTVTPATGYEFVKNGHVCTYQHVRVAKIVETEVQYPSLKDAVDAATAGQTVQLIANADITAQLTISKSIKIDLNEKTLTSKLSDASRSIVVGSSASLEIFDGSVALANSDTLGLFDVTSAKSLVMTGVAMSGNTIGESGTKGCFIFSDGEGISIALTNCTGTTNWRICRTQKSGGTLSVYGGTYNLGGNNVAFQDSGTATYENVTVNIGTQSSSGYLCAFYVNGGSALVKNCTASSPNTTHGLICVCSEGVVDIEGGVYSGKYCAKVLSSGGAINIKGGQFTGSEYVLYVDSRNAGPINVGTDAQIAKIDVTDGTFVGNFGFQHLGEMFFKGGCFGGQVALLGDLNKNHLTITGGIYTYNPTNAEFNVAKTPAVALDCVASGYEVKANPDVMTKETYPYAVSVKPVCQIGETKYETIQEAITNAVNGDTIEVIADFTTSARAMIDGKSIDVNLNGHTVTFSGNTYGIEYNGYKASTDHSVRTSGKVYNGTIISHWSGLYAADHTDVTAAGVTVVQDRGSAESSFKHCAIAASYGATLTVQSGTYTGNIAASIFTTGGVIDIKDGTFEGSDNLFYVYAPSSDESESNSVVTVSGGKFKGEIAVQNAKGYGNLTNTVTLTGGVYDQSPAAAYVPNGYAVVANADAAYPYTVGVKVNVGGETKATAVTDEQSSSVDTEKLESVVSDENYRVKIAQRTEVVGVVLTTEAETNAQGIVITPAGVQAVVDNAITNSIKTGDAAFTNALASASVVTVKVDVVVTPLSFVATNAQMTTGSISFDLKPCATVTVAKDGVAYSNIVDVTNEMIDQTRNILVSIYTGFQPQQITHWAATNDLIETFTPEQIAFADGVSTVKISHFSYLNANAVAQVAYVNGVGYTNLTQAVEAMKDGDTLQLFDTTQTPVAPNGYHFDKSGNYYTLVKNTLVEVEWESVKINNEVTNMTYLAAESQSISLPAAWGETVVGDVTITIKDADGNVIATQTVAGTETAWSFTTIPWAPGSYTVTMSWSCSTGSSSAEAREYKVSYVVEVLAYDEWGTLDIDNRIQNNTTRLADGTEVITLPASWNGAAGGTVVLHITDPDGAETTQTFTENETSWSWETAPLMPGTYQMSLTGDNVESDATNVTYVIEATAFDSAIGGAIDNYYEDDTNNVRLASTHSLDFNLKWVGATNTVLTLDGAVVKATPDANGMWTWSTNDLMGAIYTFTNVVDGVAYEAKFKVDSDLIKAIVDNGLIVRMTVAEYEGMFGQITNRSEAAIAAPLKKKTNSDTEVWQNYILLGTAEGSYNTPTNMLEAMAARVDTTALEKMETTVQPIRIKARHIPETAPAITTAGVTVTYSLMASTDNVTWTAISEGKAKPEFDIDLAERNDDFTYWKIQAVFSGDKK